MARKNRRQPAQHKPGGSTVKSDSYDSTFRSGGREDIMQVLSRAPVDLYMEDPIARRIIDVIPEEMVTNGFGLDGIPDEKAFQSTWDGMKLNEKMIAAFAWGRLHGGALVVAIVNDKGMLSAPASDGQLEQVRVYDRHQVRVGKLEENPRNPRYGEPVSFLVTPNGGKQYEVHYTRCHVIDGDRIPESKRKANGGWGASVMTPKLIHSITDFNYCQDLATQLLRRKQQAVWKAKDLALLCDDDTGRKAARLRLAQVDDNAGVGNAVGIDSEDEDYTILNSDISGVDAFLDKKFDRIVANSGIHEIILKNKNTGGVSASQNTALETFYKLVDRKRNEDYRPLLEWIIPFIISDKQWSIRFDPLSVPSDADAADTLQKNVNAVSELVTNQIIDTEEARDTMQALSAHLKLKKVMPTFEDAEPEPGTATSNASAGNTTTGDQQ